MTQPFEHEPLDQSQPSLRLIRVLPARINGQIACELVVKELPATYTALSYCWGSGLYTDILLKRAGSNEFGTYQVRTNLHSFLKHIARRPLETWIWIDAICIDQYNIGERNHQVQQIGTVYQQAQEVLVWLGSDPILAKGLAICSSAVARSSDNDERISIMLETIAKSYAFDVPELLERLRSHPYFSRLWIVQEVVLASIPALKVMCRYLTMPWYEFSVIHDLIRLIAMEKWSTTIDTSQISTIEKLSVLRYQFETKGRRQLSDILEFTQNTECLDVRDRIYGLLSLVKDGEDFQVDYARGVNDLLCRAFIYFKFQSLPSATRNLIGALKPSVGRFLDALSRHASFYPTKPMITRHSDLKDSGGLPILNDSQHHNFYLNDMPPFTEYTLGFKIFERHIDADDSGIGPEWNISASSIPSWFEQTLPSRHQQRESWIHLENQVLPARDLSIVFRHFSYLSKYKPNLLVDLENIRNVFSSSDFERSLDEPIPACFTFSTAGQIIIDPRAAPTLKAFAGSITPRYLYLHMPPKFAASLFEETPEEYAKSALPWVEPEQMSLMNEEWLIQCDEKFQAWLAPMSHKGVTDLGMNNSYLICSKITGTKRYLYTVIGGQKGGQGDGRRLGDVVPEETETSPELWTAAEPVLFREDG